MNGLTRTELAYLAGLFDGEGCILITNRKARGAKQANAHYLQICLYNTHEETIQWLNQKLSGRMSTGQTTGTTRRFTWHASCASAASVLKALLPYLRIKRAEALVALEFQASIRPRKGNCFWQFPLTAAENDFREACRQRLMDLKTYSHSRRALRDPASLLPSTR